MILLHALPLCDLLGAPHRQIHSMNQTRLAMYNSNLAQHQATKAKSDAIQRQWEERLERAAPQHKSFM